MADDAQPQPSPAGGLPPLPASVTSFPIALVGLVCATAVLLVARSWQRGEGPIAAGIISPTGLTLVCLLALALPIIGLERWRLGTHRRASTGIELDRAPDYDGQRVLSKLVGVAGSVLFLAAMYWIFPEYDGSFYDPWYRVLTWLGLPLIVATPIYVAWVDARMPAPRDSYWQLGRLLTGHRRDCEPAVLGQHLLGWLVKGFFLPLMFVYLVGSVKGLLNYDKPFLDAMLSGEVKGMRTFYDLAWDALFTVDLLYTVAGYTLTLRLLDGHLRSTEPTALGWGVALLCYQPFWKLYSNQYLEYDDKVTWGSWLGQHPALFAAWAAAILALIVVYVSAAVSFSLRFSNLTHRGVLTGGPYQFTKHPAYVSKNLAWWLVAVPFIPEVWSLGGAWDALRCCLALLGVNFVYLMRARTEERHLSRDPAYVAYATAMERRSVLRWVGRIFPFLRFAPGRLFAPWP